MNERMPNGPLLRVLSKLEQFKTEDTIENRSSDIQRKIDAYRSPIEAIHDFTEGMSIYKSMFINKRKLTDLELYKLFERTKYPSHPMEEADIKTHYFYGIEGKPSPHFREKVTPYLTQYCQDVTLAFLFHNRRSIRPNREKESKQINITLKLLNAKNRSDIHKLEKSADSTTKSISVIAKVLNVDRLTFPLLNLAYLNNLDRIQTQQIVDKLLQAITNKNVKKSIEEKLKIIPKPDKENPSIKWARPLLESDPDYHRIRDRIAQIFVGNQPEVANEYKMSTSFFELGPLFERKDYQEQSLKILKESFPNYVGRKTLVKMAYSFRRSYQDILASRNELGNQLDDGLQEYLNNPGDFSKIDMVIGQVLFENFQDAHNSHREKFKDFLKIPGTTQAIESLRKMYLIHKIRSVISSFDGYLIINPQNMSISSMFNDYLEMAKINPKKLFDSKKIARFLDCSDDNLVSQWLFLSIDKEVKKQKDEFDKRKVYKKQNGVDFDVDFDLTPDFLNPAYDKNYIVVDNIRIPINQGWTLDNNDVGQINFFAGNEHVTTIMVDRIAYS